MKRICFILLASLFACSLSAQTTKVGVGAGHTKVGAGAGKTKVFPSAVVTSVSDSFPYTNTGTLQSNSPWVFAFNTGSILVATSGASHGIYGSIAGAALDYYSTVSWGDQTVTMTVVNVTGTSVSNGGVAARCNNTGGGNGYYAVYISGTVFVGKVTSGTDSGGLTSFAQTLAVGDQLRMIVAGSGSSTRLTIQTNVSGGGFVNKVTNFDPGATYLSTGSPGVTTNGSNLASAFFGTWTATTP